MNEHLPTVALADTRWAGHHPTYFTEMSASLLRCGARVIAMCPEPGEVRENLARLGFSHLDGRLAAEKLNCRNHSFLGGSRDHDPLTSILRWRETGRLLRRIETRTGWRADLVFFPYLDNYIRLAPFPSLPGLLLRRPWSGLYLRNHHLAQPSGPLHLAAKGDLLLRSPLCRAVCVLDERFNDRLSAISGHPVVDFPDITDESPPLEAPPLAREIVAKAAGRKIIGLISMEKRKGLLTLLKAALAAHAKGEPWYFVATGPWPKFTFTSEEIAFCEDVNRRVESGAIDNLHFDTSGDRIPDGAIYNSLFTTFHLVWAAYEGFEGSSNALTKAAAFRIPVLATAGQCIGARVQKHHMGRTFPEGDIDACLAAIRAALSENTPEPDFQGYHARHSRDRLDEIFRSLLHSQGNQGAPTPRR